MIKKCSLAVIGKVSAPASRIQVFAQRAQREPAYVASLVFCSTLLALFYLPVLLALLM